MTPDRKWAEDHGMTLRDFQRVLHTAQMKLIRNEELTPLEREAWDFAMGYDVSPA